MGPSMAKPANRARPAAPSPAAGSYRYERKFLITDLTEGEVRAIVRHHPALIREIYERRWVNNIYLDSPFLHSYHDNVEGAPDRVKARVRWYGEMFGPVAKPVLEFKVKRGAVGRKELYPVDPFVLGKDFNPGQLRRLLGESGLPGDIRLKLRSLEPSLLNRYLRSYHLSADGRFRITVDTKQRFLRVRRGSNLFLHGFTDDVSVIVELKYGCDADPDAEAVSGRFPFRLTKSSKYVTGVSALCP